jgi:hypothetical protein
MNNTLTLTRKALKELISDAVGVHLLGPAALASLCEFSCRFDMDAHPIECGGYPPWRYRLRKMSEILLTGLNAVTTTGWHSALRNYLEWFQGWQKMLAESNDDRDAINNDVRSRKAYELLERKYESIRTEVLGQLPPSRQPPYNMATRYQEIGELIERIELGVPPNETGTWPNTTPAHMADIWNAAWSCKIYRFIEKKDAQFNEYLDMLFRLTLKAIESSYVHRTFGPLVKG